ncbi:unnamed protein product [Cladocopium goreaui]|uniref:Uncharacterized protein n=1 Tax=Cladocopium goreaui TaxID=2562237 RepID=A0A9P1BMT4_9DINO|nr:unnamed protein product [Cladocopium goreaui]
MGCSQGSGVAVVAVIPSRAHSLAEFDFDKDGKLLTSDACLNCIDQDGHLMSEHASIKFNEPRHSFHSMSCENTGGVPMPPIAPTQRWHECKLDKFLKKMCEDPQKLPQRVNLRRTELERRR